MKYSRKSVRKILQRVSPKKRAKYLEWKNGLTAEQKGQYAQYLRRAVAAKKA